MFSLTDWNNWILSVGESHKCLLKQSASKKAKSEELVNIY